MTPTTNPAFGKLAGLGLDMRCWPNRTLRDCRKQTRTVVAAYGTGFEREEAKLKERRKDFRSLVTPVAWPIDNCRLTLKRIEEGLTLLTKDTKACEAFLFMNRAMWLQRTHSIYSERGRRGVSNPISTKTLTKKRTAVGDRSRLRSSC